MSEHTGPPAPNPCGSCPYRRDVPSGVWSPDEYAKLPTYDGPTWGQSPHLFLCHQHERGSGQERLCAGWVGCHGGEELMALRIAGSMRSMSADDVVASMRYKSPVPLFSSGAEAAEHGMRDIEEPGEEARRVIEKIVNRRPDVRYR